MALGTGIAHGLKPEDESEQELLNRPRNDSDRRRSFLAATGTGGALLALSAAGCGSSGKKSDSGSGAAQKSSLLSSPQDTSAQAKPGGVLKSWLQADPPNFDPLLGGSSIVRIVGADYTYPRLLKCATSECPKAASGESEGDLAESYELSPDKLTMTFKLRQGLKWD